MALAASLGSADISALRDALFGTAIKTPSPIATPKLVAAMLDFDKGVSDLLFSPGRAPQVERHEIGRAHV